MTARSDRESATIYQFPKGGRAALGGRRDEAKAVDALAAPRPARIASGDAWYHEEAIQNADRARQM